MSFNDSRYTPPSKDAGAYFKTCDFSTGLPKVEALRVADCNGLPAWHARWRKDSPWRYVVNRDGLRIVYQSEEYALQAARWMAENH